LADKLDPLFEWFASDRLDGEGFGDFCNRTGFAALRERIEPRRSA
jgi:sulfite reductase beta subunit-like hemoprotein